jgi:thioredoxin reductase
MSVNAVAAQDHDLVVVGGTPAGIVLAVRADREGLRVLLVHHTGHLGGMLAKTGSAAVPGRNLRLELRAEAPAFSTSASRHERTRRSP